MVGGKRLQMSNRVCRLWYVQLLWPRCCYMKGVWPCCCCMGGYLARLLPCVYLAVLLSYNFGPRADCGFGLVCGYMWNLYVYGHVLGCSVTTLLFRHDEFQIIRNRSQYKLKPIRKELKRKQSESRLSSWRCETI